MMNYRKVIDAALNIEGGVWGLAAALADEVPTDKDGRVLNGEWESVVKTLKDAGVTTSAGTPYGKAWLRELHSTERWAREVPRGSRLAVRAFPLKRVAAARKKATGDHEQAFLLLKAGGTMHMISGTKAQPLAAALAAATPSEIAAALPKEKQRGVVYDSLKKMNPTDLREVREEVDQLHPATAKKPPLGLPKHGYGFTLEMSGASQKLISAIEAYVDAWEEHASEASEEHMQIERDLLAPHVLRLRMTIEEVPA